MLNGGGTFDISLVRFAYQGFSLSPLLCAIVAHPLVMLSMHTTNVDIEGLHLPLGGQLVLDFGRQFFHVSLNPT